MSATLGTDVNRPIEVVERLWNSLSLPPEALQSLRLPGSGLGLPSSFRIGSFAQATIGASALAAANLHAFINGTEIPEVTVPLRHACAEFKSERLYVLDGRRNENPWGPIGGLYKAHDGYIRIHDGFPHHRTGALRLLGLSDEASREEVASAVAKRSALELEDEAAASNCVIYALRSFDEWDNLPQAQALPDKPIQITRSMDGTPVLPPSLLLNANKALRGLRVVELSRVLAAPICGRTLAAHGADVLWVTSPNLPDLPNIDCDTSRGKRATQLDLNNEEDKQKLLDFIKDADVFIQSYRPGSLAARGFSESDLHALNPQLIVANLTAFGTEGPWSHRRGFDSIVQTCSGINVSEAQHHGGDTGARPLPCQALDHGAGYLLATGIITAVYRQATDGGRGYTANVSLAAVGKFLRSLGQYEGQAGFECEDICTNEDAIDFMETRMTELGEMTAIRHSATIFGLDVG